MWPQRPYEDCEPYFSSMKTSPRLKIKGGEERVLQRFEVWHSPRSKHNTLYIGGAVWCIKWVPMFKENDHQYFVTVSHSRGEDPEFMRRSPGSKPLSKGSITLWSCDREGNDIKCCYAICHDWGLVPHVEFCPSRSATENRLGLLAVTSQVGAMPTMKFMLPARKPFRYRVNYLIIFSGGFRAYTGAASRHEIYFTSVLSEPGSRSRSRAARLVCGILLLSLGPDARSCEHDSRLR